MALPPLAPGTQNLIDGRLVAASNGATFENVNPATEEVIGVVADGTKEDMERAIGAARRVFDATSWSRDHAFRAKCIAQLYDALKAEKEQLRAIVVAEAGACVTLTGFMHVDEPIEGMKYWATKATQYPYERSMPDISFLGQPQRRLLL